MGFKINFLVLCSYTGRGKKLGGKLLVLFVSQRRENKYASDCELKQLYVRIYLKENARYAI